MVDKKTKRFISGWELSKIQKEYILENGNLGGGK
jgi:hypothetical protein